MGASKKHESIKAYDSVVHSTCAFCPSGCGVKIYLNEEEVVDLWGEENHPLNKGSLCGKGSAAARFVHHPQRIRFALARRGLGEQFRELAWDDALDLVAQGVRRILERYGPESVLIQSSEPLSFTAMVCARRFGRLIETPNVILPIADGPFGPIGSVFGTRDHGILMNPPHDWVHSRCILVVGTDLSTTDVVTTGWLIDARERETKIIAMGAKFTPLLSKADVTLQPKPGTEAALLMAIANVLIQRNHYQEEFVKSWVTGFEAWAEVCKPFTPEKVAHLSWVPAEKILRAAELVARNSPLQVLGMNRRLDQNLHDLIQSAIGLIALTGSIGVPGGGLNILGTVPPISASGDADLPSRHERPSGPAERSVYEALRGSETHPIKAIIWDGNPLAEEPGLGRLRQALNGVDLVVHLGFFPSLTQNSSHVVLPLASWVECDGLIPGGNSRALQWHNQAISPGGECRSYADFWFALADHMGLGASFPWRKGDGSADIRAMTDYFLRQEPLTRACSVDQIDPEKVTPGGILWPCTSEEGLLFETGVPQRGKGILFRPNEHYPGEEKRFPTPSGKLELFRLVEQASPLRAFMECNGKAAQRFPLILNLGRPVSYIEGVGYCLEELQDTQPDLSVQIHPKVAERLGVANGDWVVVENGEGAIEGRAWITTTVDVACIWCPAGTDECQRLLPFKPFQSLCLPPSGGTGFGELSLSRVRLYPKGKGAERSTKALRILLQEEGRWAFSSRREGKR